MRMQYYLLAFASVSVDRGPSGVPAANTTTHYTMRVSTRALLLPLQVARVNPALVIETVGTRLGLVVAPPSVGRKAGRTA